MGDPHTTGKSVCVCGAISGTASPGAKSGGGGGGAGRTHTNERIGAGAGGGNGQRASHPQHCEWEGKGVGLTNANQRLRTLQSGISASLFSLANVEKRGGGAERQRALRPLRRGSGAALVRHRPASVLLQRHVQLRQPLQSVLLQLQTAQLVLQELILHRQPLLLRPQRLEPHHDLQELRLRRLLRSRGAVLGLLRTPCLGPRACGCKAWQGIS